jgi:hypothetical protein
MHKVPLSSLLLAIGCSQADPKPTPSSNTPEPLSHEVLPPDADLGGMTLAEAGADWWRWALEHPVTNNPVMDETGAFCEEGQSGDVFYLAGTFTSDTSVERTCVTTHTGTFLIPIGNIAWDNCGTPPEDVVTDQELIDGVNSLLDEFDSASLVIDGDTIGTTIADFAQYRTEVTAYSFTNPATDSLYALWGGPFDGVCDPSYAAGYYVPFKVSSPGEHDIALHAGTSIDGWSIDVHYTLKVQDP